MKFGNLVDQAVNGVPIDFLVETAGSPPGSFTVAIDLDTPEALKQLSRGKLEGVKGISSSGQILFYWLNIGRDGALVMDGRKTMALNPGLREIDYSDPEALAADGMALLFRIWDKNPNMSHGRFGFMQNLMGYMKPFFRSGGHHDLWYLLDYGTMSPTQYAKFFSESSVRLDSSREIALWLSGPCSKRVIDENYYEKTDEAKERLRRIVKETPLSAWEDAVRGALRKVGEVYSSEAEWSVPEELKVPRGSKLLIIRDVPLNTERGLKAKIANLKSLGMKPKVMKSIDSLIFRKFKEMGNRRWKIHELGLDKKYKIVWVDPRRFDKARVNHYVKRGSYS